jgi:polar amino acid transport system substrate-binding protein
MARSATAAEPTTVTTGFGINKPPYVLEAENSGLEVELVKAAFKAVGIDMKPYFAPQVRLHALMQRRAIDALTATTEQTGVTAFYSDVYISYHNYAITLSSRKDINIQRIEDLANYSVTSFVRAQLVLGPRFRAAVAKSPKYSEPPQQSVRNLLLYSGRVDVAVGDQRIFDYYRREVSKLVNVDQAVTYHDIFPPTEYKVGFRSAELRDRFNAGLAMIRKNGVYAEISQRYKQTAVSD